MEGIDAPLDRTVESLNTIVAETRTDGSSNGFFAAMYRTVTLRTRDATRDGGFFDDDRRMANLAVVFADRYLDAYRAYRDAGEPTETWRVTFDIGDQSTRRMIVQHLLLGMNAHINLDLGIAAAEVAPGDGLRSMYRDFLRINEVLFQMVDGLQDGLSGVSPGCSSSTGLEAGGTRPSCVSASGPRAISRGASRNVSRWRNRELEFP